MKFAFYAELLFPKPAYGLFMLNKKIQAVVAATLISSSLAAHAGTITVGGDVVSNPAHLETFESGTARSNLTGQYGTNGLTFQTLGTNGITLLAKANCNNLGGVPTNKYLAMGFRFPCSTDASLNSVSIQFAANVSDLSWFGFNRSFGDGFTIQALLDGTVVSQTAFNVSNKFEDQVVRFSGATFDEIRFTEAAASQGYFAFDNMAWNLAAPTPPEGTVPVPGTLALLGFGMAGLGLMRKKKTAPAR